ncbi:MAG: hypothetical protein K6V97_07365 [Actinomycetia bacterium]|nr:hypothetical protein [Actinomycetes bacterium]
MIRALNPPRRGEGVLDPATGLYRWLAEHFDVDPVPVTMLVLDNGRGGADVLFSTTAAYRAARQTVPDDDDPVAYGEALWAALREAVHWSPQDPRATASWHALPRDVRESLRAVHNQRRFPYALPPDEVTAPDKDLTAIFPAFRR